MLVTALSSCSHVTAPPERVSAELSYLAAAGTESYLADSGVLVVYAAPADTSWRLGLRQFILMTATTTHGDSESMVFETRYCGQYTSCTSLDVVMRAGHSLAELKALVQTLPARFFTPPIEGRYGAVRVVRLDAVESVLGVLRSQSSVQSVDRSSYYVGAGVTARSSATKGVGAAAFCQCWILSAVPLRLLPPTSGNGTLEIAHGDTIRVRHHQTSGAELTATIAIP